MNNLPYDIGSEISVVQSVPPQLALVANTGVAINGAAVDRLVNGALAMSCKANIHLGVTTNTPTAVTATQKIQDSADGSTGWADYKPDGTNTAQSTTGAAAYPSDSNLSVNLRMAKRYIRQVITPNLTGASSTLGVAGTVALGGLANTPIVTPAP